MNSCQITEWDGQEKKANIAKSYKRLDDLESHDHRRPCSLSIYNYSNMLISDNIANRESQYKRLCGRHQRN